MYMTLHTTSKRSDRIKFLLNQTGSNVESIEHAFIDDEKKTHCENLIGAVTVPLGIAGPVTINGEYTKGEYYVPLATTEGALVASVNRGCKVITKTGGVNVYAYKSGTTRGPVFYTPTLAAQRTFYTWLKTNESALRQTAETTSRHLSYKKMMIKSVGQYTFVRFVFDTDDAMGMNMATIASQKMVEYIQQQTDIECMGIAGNFDIDKKAAWLNFIENRGFKVWAEVVIPEEIVKTALKTTPKRLHDVWLAKCMFGSAMSGSLGFNAHYANIVAALFAATGQDLAHVVEGSMGITSAIVQDDGSLYFSVYLPAVMVGTVGGGTGLKTQTEARNIIKVKKSDELAEVVGAAVLAGELSLLASIAEGSLAKSHAKLGR